MLLSIGKPMIDIIVEVDDDVLKKYNLRPNNAIKATESQAELFKDILKLNPKFVVGGSVTNSLRVFQWAMSNKEKVFYIGVIGQDAFGLQIKLKLEKENIEYNFLKNSIETVQCAVLISNNGKNRSLISNSNLKPTRIIINERIKINEIKDQVIKCSCFYVTTFSLVAFAQVIKEIVELFISTQKNIVVNLGATYILQTHQDDVKYLIKHANVVIGNDEEYKILGKIYNCLAADLEILLREITSLNSAQEKDTIFVVTRGHRDILVCNREGITYFKVEPMHQILDTTAAGDAFAGGFLTQYMQNKSLEDCIYCGVACASHIIQHYGCDFDVNFNRNLLFRTKM